MNEVKDAIEAVRKGERVAHGREPLPARPARVEVAGDPLSAGTRTVKGVGQKMAESLAERGIDTVGDLVRILPRSYEDRRRGGKVADLEDGKPGFVVGAVHKVRTLWARRHKGLRIELRDDDDRPFFLVWFAAYNLTFEIGERLRASGIARTLQGGRGMVHADVERLAGEEDAAPSANPIVPRYPEVEGIARKRLWRLIGEALSALPRGLADPLPAGLRRQHALPSLEDSLRAVHFPTPASDILALGTFRSPAQRRLIFEELFALQLALARAARGRAEEPGIALTCAGRLDARLRALLPFQLTGAQERALAEIRADLRGSSPMSRLLQGDVGSGKTIVAFGAALAAIEDGLQVVVLAPTEVLAEQHHRVLGGLAGRLGIYSVLVTSALAGARRKAVREELRSGLAKLVIGTQALLEDAIELDALGLCIVDEQHRFGVLQRAAITAKGRRGQVPHLLVMTATPIPRTLAMTLYGDLSASVLDEKPPGREPVQTRLFRAGKRDSVYQALRRATDAGAQAFVVVPLVDVSEKVELRAAVETHAELAAGPLAGVSVGLLHGRLDADDKRAALARFSSGEDRVLVCTTVVEVGVDVPAATVLVVEHAERFGLAQLHQLRGRIGRAGGAAHCFLLLGAEAGEEAEARLRILCESDDGFRIAEADLRLRGPGEIFGTMQAGTPALVVADLLRDQEILKEAREAAFALVARDPRLLLTENARAWEVLSARYGPLLELVRIG